MLITIGPIESMNTLPNHWTASAFKIAVTVFDNNRSAIFFRIVFSLSTPMSLKLPRCQQMSGRRYFTDTAHDLSLYSQQNMVSQ